jgi:hypothetical protein
MALLHWVSLVLIFFTSCTTVNTKDNVIKKRHANFGVALLPDSWEKKNFRDTDLFFEHKSDDAAIYVRAQCEKFSDSPLEALTSQMLVGMGKYEIISQKLQSIDQRQGLVTEVRVNLDGVFRSLKIMVLRKNRCVFDAVLNAPQLTPVLAQDFDDMVKSFWAEADL